jgi:hypothetical protein
MNCVILIEEFVRSALCSVERILAVVIEEGDWFHYYITVLDTDGVGSWVVEFYYDVFAVVAICVSSLELESHINWWFGLEGHVVNLINLHD